MITYRITTDGKYIEKNYPISEYEDGSEFFGLRESKPANLIRDTGPITMEDGKTYGTGTVWADESNHGKGGLAVAWPLSPKLVPVRDFEWTDDYSYHRSLTCKNHPTARYLTKNPWNRSIHLVKRPEGDIERNENGECTCPFNDLMVIVP